MGRMGNVDSDPGHVHKLGTQKILVRYKDSFSETARHSGLTGLNKADSVG